MHRAMEDMVAEHVSRTLSDQTRLLRMLLLQKFRGQKLRITAKRRAFIEEIVAAVAAGRSTDGISLTSSRALDLTLSDADVESLKTTLHDVIAKATEASMRAAVATASQAIVDSARSTAKEQREANARATRRLVRPWAGALDWLRASIGVCHDAAYLAAELPPDRSMPKHKRQALLALHVHGCLVSGEVLALLESGYASGALARWRALHEVTVIATFIADRCGETAKRFLQHEAANAERIRKATAVGLGPDEEVLPLHSRHARILRRQAQGFGADYGWASPDLGLKRPVLSDLLSDEDRRHWSHPYELACGAVHPRSATVGAPLGHAGPPWQHLLIGPSSADLHLAADWTIARLSKLTATCAVNQASLDDAVMLAAVHKVAHRARREVERAWLKWCELHAPVSRGRLRDARVR